MGNRTREDLLQAGRAFNAEGEGVDLITFREMFLPHGPLHPIPYERVQPVMLGLNLNPKDPDLHQRAFPLRTWVAAIVAGRAMFFPSTLFWDMSRLAPWRFRMVVLYMLEAIPGIREANPWLYERMLHIALMPSPNAAEVARLAEDIVRSREVYTRAIEFIHPAVKTAPDMLGDFVLHADMPKPDQIHELQGLWRQVRLLDILLDVLEIVLPGVGAFTRGRLLSLPGSLEACIHNQLRMIVCGENDSKQDQEHYVLGLFLDGWDSAVRAGVPRHVPTAAPATTCMPYLLGEVMRACETRQTRPADDQHPVAMLLRDLLGAESVPYDEVIEDAIDEMGAWLAADTDTSAAVLASMEARQMSLCVAGMCVTGASCVGHGIGSTGQDAREEIPAMMVDAEEVGDGG
jgi:hypothetical protein